ncbi:hypothetical protein [Pseudonocardia alni]|uniref:hypothetical protein n=1 Tax=Pseudonocardia alni TaxID=33907 RepID=UPI001AD66252|nr:hypothetical protein [Pseudonocardia alni]MBO4239245.1 hypothetical protein [Pseudonocardia alni]
MQIGAGWPTVLAVVTPTAIAALAARAGGTGTARMSVRAAVRAVVRLAAVAGVIVFVVRHRWATRPTTGHPRERRRPGQRR